LRQKKIYYLIIFPNPLTGCFPAISASWEGLFIFFTYL